MNIVELLEALEHGVDKKDHSVKGKVKDQAGHNNNSLDVIMPRKPIQWVIDVAERLGATGGHALTVTFTDEYLFKFKERYLIMEVGKIMKSTRGVMAYIFVNDMSKTGRFHLHGVVRFKDIKVITNLRRKLSKFGISKVKAIDNSPRWSEYITRQFSDGGKEGIKINPEGLLYISST